jgi:hypothetical protein
LNLSDFLEHHHLDADPFASTNAEEEEFLTDYFVRPPYFASVLGIPSQPKSSIVFAPRGGGKTAQRRVLEEDSRSAEANYLCVLYDSFPPGTNKADIARIDVEAHLERVAVRLLMAILLELEDNPSGATKLDKADNDFVTARTASLENITRADLETVIRSLKSRKQVAGDWLRTHSGPVKMVVSSLLKKRGIDLDPTLPWAAQFAATSVDSQRTVLSRLVDVVQKLGFESVYVMIDKLDETALTTTDPGLTADLVAPLLLDLPAMEMPGIAYKVFIWDLSKPRYDERGGRPDRIPEHQLVWSAASLEEMMSRRLQAFSSGTVTSLNQLTCGDLAIDLDGLAAHLAYGSPRDMIRLCARIVDEHLNQTAPSGNVGAQDLWSAVRLFSSDIAQERGGKFMPDLQRLETYRFTQGKVSNDYLRIKKQSVQAKVVEWRRTAMIDKVTEVQDSRSRPQHLYGVVDPRLAVAIKPDENVEDVLGFYLLFCPSCDRMNISDEMEVTCIGCQRQFTQDKAEGLISRCGLA